MFLPVQCNSVNKPSILGGVKLGGSCSRYRGAEDEDILLFEYLDVESQRMVACDIVVITSGSEMRMHDYLLLSDGNWRNSYGEVSGSLVDLFPDFVSAAVLVVREEITVFTVENS